MDTTQERGQVSACLGTYILDLRDDDQVTAMHTSLKQQLEQGLAVMSLRSMADNWMHSLRCGAFVFWGCRDASMPTLCCSTCWVLEHRDRGGGEWSLKTAREDRGEGSRRPRNLQAPSYDTYTTREPDVDS